MIPKQTSIEQRERMFTWISEQISTHARTCDQCRWHLPCLVRDGLVAARQVWSVDSPPQAS
jgi:hypothetical protein